LNFAGVIFVTILVSQRSYYYYPCTGKKWFVHRWAWEVCLAIKREMSKNMQVFWTAQHTKKKVLFRIQLFLEIWMTELPTPILVNLSVFSSVSNIHHILWENQLIPAWNRFPDQNKQPALHIFFQLRIWPTCCAVVADSMWLFKNHTSNLMVPFWF
jgi:hypothetical protein